MPNSFVEPCCEVMLSSHVENELLLHTSVDSPRGYFMVLIRARTSDGVVSKSVCLEIAERDGLSTRPRVTQTAQLWRCGRRQPR